MVKNFLAWLLLSSKNPNDLSLSVKGFLVMYSPALAFGLGLLHLPADASTISQTITFITELVQQAMVMVGAAVFIVGIVRKLIVTLHGRNVLAGGTPIGPVIIAQDVPLDSVSTLG